MTPSRPEWFFYDIYAQLTTLTKTGIRNSKLCTDISKYRETQKINTRIKTQNELYASLKMRDNYYENVLISRGR